jgi:hypothetical protein
MEEQVIFLYNSDGQSPWLCRSKAIVNVTGNNKDVIVAITWGGRNCLWKLLEDSEHGLLYEYELIVCSY